MSLYAVRLLVCMAMFARGTSLGAASTFRVATYNIDNYFHEPTQSRYAKSAEAKAAVRQTIHSLNPDVLVLEEIGTLDALQELRSALKTGGLDFPVWEYLTGADTNIHLAILSRFPFTARRPHTNESFLLSGRRFRVNRGFAEVDVQVNSGYSFTLIAAHLKSKRMLAMADEAEVRLEEARLLRQKIEARLRSNPEANLVVVGDLNDTKDSPPVKAVLGRGRDKLIDTRPVERRHDASGDFSDGLESVSWTYYYAKEDIYSRIDYILLSAGMAREWSTNETYILALPNWFTGSDHRPLLATFQAVDQ
jgi:endonuclease/exonuclease/phosphatase family metal-dependent hydrolase